MKKTIICLILFFRWFSPGWAQSPAWTDLSSHVPTSVSNANLTDVAAVGESVWISCSNLKGVFHSTDGGNTFTFSDLGVGIQGLYRFSDGIRGWCVGGAYGFKTEDGGESWTPVFIGSTLLSLTFANDQVGYATGSGSVYRTDDGGATWVKQSDIFNLINRDVTDAAFPDPVNPLEGFVCVANEISTIFKTNNGGDTWEYVTLSWVTSSVVDFDFPDSDHGWAVGGESNIFRFENNGWSFQSAPSTAGLNAVSSASDTEDCWAVGNSGTILHFTPSSGWLQEATGLTDEYLAGVDAVNSNTVYGVGMNKTFLKYMIVNNVPEKTNNGIEIFPNPTSGNLSVRSNAFHLKDQMHEITFLDLSGKELLKTEGIISKGEITLDASSLPSGIYLLKIKSDQYTIVKRVIRF